MRFLRALKRNNRREWFQPRKEAYERQVKAPMLELVGALCDDMMKFAPAYVSEPERAVFRIYRDTRFAHDKSPYKTHIAAVFTRRGMVRMEGAGLYFSISPEEVEVAGGLYMPGPDQLRAVRGHLLEHHGEFRRILASRSLRALMGELQGERLSRAPKGFDPLHPAAGFIQCKQWLLDIVLDPAVAVTPGIFDEVRKRFRAMTPFVEFLNAPLAASRPKPMWSGPGTARPRRSS